MPIPPSRVNLDYWTTLDGQTVNLMLGDALNVAKQLPSQSIHCIITSPPYFDLRDYKTGSTMEIGQERKPSQYVDAMVGIFAELRRVLRDDGTLWLNLGDKYAYKSCGGSSPDGDRTARATDRERMDKIALDFEGIGSGNLLGMPWRVALALQADGWCLRQDIIWHKPSPIPESVDNRCTKAHEYVFLMTKKSSGYFYDAEAISEAAQRPDSLDDYADKLAALRNGEAAYQAQRATPLRSNKRDVWRIAPRNYSGGHFATFPMSLVEPCLKAGTSEWGCCAKCGAPYRRVTKEIEVRRYRPNDYVKRTGEPGTGNVCPNSIAAIDVKTIGWEPTCDCRSRTNHDEPIAVEPCTVLDPFIGSGTTACCAIALGRRCWGIDLSRKYLDECAIPRIEGELAARPALHHLSPRIAAEFAKHSNLPKGKVM